MKTLREPRLSSLAPGLAPYYNQPQMCILKAMFMRRLAVHVREGRRYNDRFESTPERANNTTAGKTRKPKEPSVSDSGIYPISLSPFQHITDERSVRNRKRRDVFMTDLTSLPAWLNPMVCCFYCLFSLISSSCLIKSTWSKTFSRTDKPLLHSFTFPSLFKYSGFRALNHSVVNKPQCREEAERRQHHASIPDNSHLPRIKVPRFVSALLRLSFSKWKKKIQITTGGWGWGMLVRVHE